MFAMVLATLIGVPTPSPTISPLPSPVVQWYARRGAVVSGLDPAFVRAVIDAESGGDPRAVSSAGAAGMMQLLPDTASDCGIRDRFDAEENVECGAKTLAYLVRRFGIENGIAAYNFGGGNVDAVGGHFKKMPAETQNYVKSVIDDYDVLQHERLPVEAPAIPAPAPRPEGFEPSLGPNVCSSREPEVGIFALECSPEPAQASAVVAAVALLPKTGAVGGD